MIQWRLAQKVDCWFNDIDNVDWSNSTSAADVKMDGYDPDENHLLRCWGCLSHPNWIRVFTLSLLLKLHPIKWESWFVLRNFLLLRLLCMSINLPYDLARNTVVMAFAPRCYWEMLDKLQKRVCSTNGPSLADCLEPLTYRGNVVFSLGINLLGFI